MRHLRTACISLLLTINGTWSATPWCHPQYISEHRQARLTESLQSKFNTSFCWNVTWIGARYVWQVGTRNTSFRLHTHTHTSTHKLVIMVNKTTKSHLISLSPDYPRWTSSRNVQFISAQQHHYHRYCRTNSHSSFPFVITMHSITWFYCKIIHNLAGLADLNHWF